MAKMRHAHGARVCDHARYDTQLVIVRCCSGLLVTWVLGGLLVVGFWFCFCWLLCLLVVGSLFGWLIVRVCVCVRVISLCVVG